MRLNIRVTGAAGLGMNSTADIIADVFAELGYHVNTDIQYQSIIKWGINYFDIFVSDESKFISKYVDVLVALDAKNLEEMLPFLKEKGIIIVNSKHLAKLDKKWISLEKYQILPLEIDAKYDNTYLISILAKLFSLEHEIIESKIEKIFKRKGQITVDANIKIFKHIYSEYNIPVENKFWALKRIWEARKSSYGNKALTQWAIAGELEYYSAYPMTPASTILTEVIKDGTVPYLQAEDEISVAMSALGASFAGKRSMVWTSGWGFALMTESISFAQQAEIPLVMAFAQRAGPSTGTPTFHEQWDLNFVLNPSFGDFEHIVVAPSSLENAYYTGAQALNLAQKYQTTVIVLIDKQFADGKATLEDDMLIPEIERWKLETNPATDYKRYELTDDGISPYTMPGMQDWDFIATSYEHDEFWATTEDSAMKVAMTEKRWKKLENFFEKEGITGYDVYNNEAKKMIVTTSYTIYTAKEFIKNNPEFGLIIIHFLKPFDGRLLDELKWKDEVIFVESNYSGQLENYITKELWLKYVDGLEIKNLRKYDLYPFYYEDFETLK
jgi:2-oxoglutarate ferredoxin oxidoreductase subunit alpha